MSIDEWEHEHIGTFTRTQTAVILECTVCGDIELIAALPPPAPSGVAPSRG